MKEKLLTIQEAASLLNVSTKTLRRWDESGKFSPERTAGNQRRYRLSHVMDMQKPQRKSTKNNSNQVQNSAPTSFVASADSTMSKTDIVSEQSAQSDLRASEETASAPLSIFDQIKADRDKALSAPLIKEDSPFVPVAELPKAEYIWPTVSAPVDSPIPTNPHSTKNRSKGIFVIHSIPYRHVFVAGIIAIIALSVTGLAGYGAMMKFKKAPVNVASTKGVLSAEDVVSNYILKVNVPGILSKKATFLDAVEIKKNLDVSGLASLTGGVETYGANINAGTGKVTGSNLVYSIVAGSNISVTGDPQNPTITADLSGIEELIEPGVTSLQGQKGDVNFTGGSGILVNGTEISNDGVLSLQGQKGAINFKGGSGISLNGLDIVNTGVLSLQGQTGAVAFTAGEGIAISGTEIINTAMSADQNTFSTIAVGSDLLTADQPDDTFSFSAGSGIVLTPDVTGKNITIQAVGIPGQWSSDGSDNLYYLLGNVGIGTSTPSNALDVSGDARITGLLTVGNLTLSGMVNGVLHSVGGVLSASAVQLGTEVAGTLGAINGGTGLNTSPASGQILIGNGTGYNLGTMVEGSGITIATGANTISVTNNGVLSLAGTANQIYASGSTGAVTLSLPQNIHTGSAPTFASLNLSTNTNQLTLGTGNTGVITLAGLSSGRTYTLPDASGEFCLSSGNCPGGGAGGLNGSGSIGYVPKFTSVDTVGDSSIYDNGKVGIGTTSPEGLFSVSGTATTSALVTLNETGGQNILTGSASGTTRFVFDSVGNLGIFGGAYMVDGVQVLSDTALGNTVTSSQLASVGNLSSGTIVSGFGSITTSSTIQGSRITATDTTGFVAEGAGAGLTFSGIDNHIISASQGELQLGAVTLLGNLDANSNDIVNIQNLTANGTVTYGGYTQNGGVMYTNGTGQLQQTTAGTDGQVLMGQTASGPSFVTLSGDAQVSSTGTITIQNNAVQLGQDTVGNYVSGITGGSGITVTGVAGEGWIPSVVLGNLSEDWSQGSAYDIVLNNAGSELRMLESAGNTYYGTIDVGDLDSNKTYTFPNVSGATATVCLQELGNCAGGSTSDWSRNGTVLSPLVSTDQVVIGGNTTTNSQFEVTGARPANPLVLFNETGDQNILVGQASGVNRFIFDRSGNVNITGNYQINGTSVLSASQLGTGVLDSSLTKVGILTSGSIANGFGEIVTINKIQGSELVASGANGVSTTAVGAGLTFGSTGTHLISATAGTLQINAFSLGGDITGGNYSITGLTNLTATGTITTGLTSGIIKSNAGVLESGSVSLNSTETSGILPTAKGGTGKDFSGTATGSLMYFSGPGTIQSLAPGSDGYVLTTHGVGNVPSWESTSSLGTNYWNQLNGGLSPKNLTESLYVGGDSTASAKLSVNGFTGALTTAGPIVFSSVGNVQTTGGTLTIGSASTGNITLNPTGGSGTVSSSGTMNLSVGKEYQIAGSSVLSYTTLGNSVLTSSLQTVGNLATGSIVDGFGSIYTNQTIRGTDITSAGTTGFTAEGVGADLTFSGTGIHTIGGNGTVQIGAFTMGGTITGGGNSISGLGGLTSAGSIQFSGIGGSGIVTSDVNGNLSVDQVDLTTEVENILPIANGGTGLASAGSAGTIIYSTGLAFANSTVGQSGEVLVSGGANAPTWVDAETLGVNYWNELNGGLSPKQLTESLYVGGDSTASAKVSVNGVTGDVTSAGGISAVGAIGSSSTVTGTQLVSTVAQGTAPLSVTSNTVVSNLNADLLDGQSGSYYQNASNINAGTLGTSYLTGSYTGITGVGTLTAGTWNGTAIGTQYGGTGANLSTAVHGSVFYMNSSGVFQALAPGTSGQVLRTNGTGVDPDWVTASGLGTNYWTEANGGLSPNTLTNDLFIGGNSSASAKLQIDGATGDIFSNTHIILNPNEGAGRVRIKGLTSCNTIDTDANGELTCGSDEGGVGSAAIINVQSNGLAIGTNVDTLNFSTDFALNASPSNRANITIADNILNFSELSNSLSLDADTGIALGNYDFTIGNGSGTGGLTVNVNAGGDAGLIINKTGTGDILTASSGGTTQFTINNSGAITTGTWNGTAIGTQYGGTGANLSASANGTLFVMNGGTMTALSQGNNLQILQSTGSGTAPTWVDASVLGTNYWNELNGGLSPKQITESLYVGGDSTGSAKLSINGITGELTTLGAISAGGAINATGSITSSTTVQGANLSASGLNAGLAFSGSGTHTISGSNLQINAFSMGGDIAGGGTYSITGLSGISAGNATLTGLTAGGVVHAVAGTGALSVGAVNLSSEVSGTLPTLHGGLGGDFSTQAKGSLLYFSDVGTVLGLGLGTGGQVLVSNTTSGLPEWADASGMGTNYWSRINGGLTPNGTTESVYIGGNATASAKLSFNGVTGSILTEGSLLFDNVIGNIQTTGNQYLNIGGDTTGNIYLKPQNGSGVVDIDGNLNLADTKQLYINNVSVLSSTTLGNSVTASGLQSVGALTGGSIANGFGTIDTNSTIAGSTITAKTAGGFAGTASGAGLTFTGGGVNLISSTNGGELQLGAFTLGGNITGNNSYSISGIDDLTASGTITFSGLGNGFVKNDSSLGLSIVSAVNLANGDVSGTLPVTKGGTGRTTVGPEGTLVYSDGSAYQFTATGSANQVLSYNGATNQPEWRDAASVGTNYWQSNSTDLAPVDTNDNLVIGGANLTASKFAIMGATGNATTSGTFTFNGLGSLQTTGYNTLMIGGDTTGNITLSPKSGDGLINSTGSLNLAVNKTYQIDGKTVLSGTSLGSEVISSVLTSVGVLGGGSIDGAFGSIKTSNLIQGSNFVATNGGFSSSADEADLTFSGIGNHTLSVSSGTLQLGAVQLIGTISGNGNDITNVRNLDTTGSVKFSAFGTAGILKNSADGTVSSGKINLASSTDVNGQLGLANGGTGADLSAVADGRIFYKSGTALVALSAGSSGEVLLSTGAGTAPQWGDASSMGVNYWQAVNEGLSPINLNNNLYVGGNATASAKLTIEALTGKIGFGGAGTITATGDISINLNGGAGLLNSTGSINVSTGKEYMIGGASILNATTLANSVINSNLTKVGALVTGSIGSGFGTINTTSTIAGSTITAKTGGFISEGVGAGLEFSGNNTHLISASGGTLSLGAVTLAGTMSAVLNDITQVRDLDTTGTVKFANLSGGAGIVHVDSNGLLSGGSLNLASSDVSGILPMSNGGTGANLNGTGLQGAVPFVTSGGVMKLTGIGSMGQVLTAQGANQDLIWTDASALGINYWQLNNGVLAPKNAWESLMVGGSATASAKFAVNGVTGSASMSGALTIINGSIQSANMSTLTLGGAQTGNIVLTPLNGSGNVTITGLSTGVVKSTAGVLYASAVNLATGDVSGILPIANGGLGADFTSAARGTIFYKNNSGGISALAPGTDGNVLTTRSTTADPEWTSASSLGTNFWQQSAEGLAPLQLDKNLLIGGATQATSKFSVNAGTGNASMSGALTLLNGSIQTQNMNTLTLGGAQTGNIVLSPAGGVGTVSISGLGTGILKSSGGTLSIGTVDLGGTEVSNILPVGKGGTGADLSSAPNGSLFVMNGGVLSALGQGTNGQVFRSNGAGSSPSWMDASAVGTNFWQRSAEGLAPNTTTDNLLIGANTLNTSKFAVLGSSGTASTSGNFAFRGTNSQINLLNGSALGFFNSVGGDSGLSATPSLYINPKGQIGIGTTTFTNTTVSLHLVNTTSANQTPIVAFGDAGNSTRYQFLADGGGGSALLMTGTKGSVRTSGDLSLQTNGANDRITIKSDGKVGVGTTTPVSLFDVAGTASISGMLTLGSSVQSFNNQTLTIGGNQTGNIVFNPLNGAGNVAINNFGSCSKVYTVNGVLTCGTDAGGSGSVGVIYVENNNTPVGTDITTLNFSSDFLVSDASPQANISVADNALNFSELANSMTLDATTTSVLGNYNFILGDGSAGTGNVQINTASSNPALAVNNTSTGSLITATQGGNNRFVVSNAGSVGITAGQSIDTLTAGAMHIGTSTQNALTIGRTTAPTTLNGSTLDLVSGAGSAISLKPAGTTSLLLASNGNVTIGAGGANSLTLNSTTYQNGGGGCGMLSTNASGVVQCSSIPTGVNYWQMNEGALSPFSSTLDFLIGGTSSASAKLAVSNGINNSTVLVNGNTNKSALSVNQTGGGDLITASASGTTRFTITNAGDIKLGTTTRITNAGVGSFITGTTIGTQTFTTNAIVDSGALSLSASGANILTLQNSATGDIRFFDANNRITSAGVLHLASDANIGGNVNVSTFNNVLATNATNTLINPNVNAIASSPISSFLWHDLFAFNKVTTPVFETSTNQGGAWSAGTLNSALFNQKEAQSVTVLDGGTTNGARWTWNDADLAWSGGEWLVLGFNYTGTAASKSIVVETSANGSTWTTRHTSSGVTATSTPLWLKVASYSGDTYIRLTITVNNAQPVPMSTIRLLTARWGDQGQGSELAYPYSWDTDQNMAIGKNAVTANGILTIGTDTTTTAGGMYFGTDTNLYRSAGNTLKTDDAFTANTLTSATSLTIGGVTNCSFLNTNGSGVVGCGSAPTAVNYWQLNAGAVSPLDSNNDLLVGSNATASAKFAVSTNGTNSTATVNGTTAKSALSVINSGTGDLLTASAGAVTRFTITNAGNVNIPGLTASRALFTDANKNLTSSGASSALSDALSDETGTGGVAVFSSNPAITSPDITTSLTTASTSFALLNANATTINFGAGATTAINMGGSAGSLNLGNGGAYTIATVSNDNLTVAPNGTGSLILGGASNTNIRLAKTGLTSCTALTTDASGNIGCSSVPLSANLWSKTGANLSPATANDNVYLSGSSKMGVNVDPSTMTTGVASFNGNVGIGVTSPSYLLDVTGGTNPLARFKSTGAVAATLGLDNSQASVGTYLRLSDNGVEKWQAGMIGGVDYILNNVNLSNKTTIQASNTANKLYLYPTGSGQVGINNSNPQSALDVSGDIRATNSLTFTGAGSVVTSGANALTLSTGTGAINLSTNGSTKLALNSTGTLTLASYTNGGAGCGMLTTDTSGNVVCGSAPTASGINTVQEDGVNKTTQATTLNFLNHFTVGGTASVPTIDITNNTLNWSDFNNAPQLDATTTTNLQGHSMVFGNGTGLGNVKIDTASTNASLIVNNASTGNLFVASQAGTTKFTINNSGYVGIGATAPATLLDLTSSNTNNGLRIYNSGRGEYMQIADNGTDVIMSTGGTQTSLYSSSPLTMLGNTVYGNNTASGILTLESTSNATKGYVNINPTGTATNGRVGINTATPRSSLDLGLDGAELTIGGSTTGGQINFGEATNKYNSIRYSNNALGFYTNQSSGFKYFSNTDSDTSTPELVLSDAGDLSLGRGDTAADARLVVRGNASSGNLINIESNNGVDRFLINSVGNITLGGGGGGTTNLTIAGGTNSTADTDGGNITFDATMGSGEAKSGDFIFRTANQTGGSYDTIGMDGSSSRYLAGTTTNSTTVTVASARTNVLVLVHVSNWTSVNSASFNSNSNTTPVASVLCAGGGSCHNRTFAWQFASLSAGTYTYSVTQSSANDSIIAAQVFYNVDQTTPYTYTTAQNNANTISASLSTTTNNVIVDNVAWAGVYDMSHTTGGGTQLWKNWSSSGGMGYTFAGSSGTSTTQYTHAGGNSEQNALIMLSLNPNQQNNGSIGSLTERMRVLAEGAVGIGGGTYDSTNALDVNGSVELALANDGTEAVCHTGDNAQTDAVLTSCSGAPAADYAELYATAQDVEYGDLVKVGDKAVYIKALDGDGKILEDGSTVEDRQLVKSTQAYDPHVIGIVSNNYGDFSSTGHGRIDESDHPMPVALSGRVPVKIASTSEEIHAGDVLSASDEPGKAMKAVRAGQAIGKALEDWSPTSGKATVLTFVNNFYYDPTVYLTDTGDINVIAGQSSPDLPTTYILKNAKEEVLNRVGVFSDMAIGNAKVGSMSAEKLVLGGRDVEERLSALEAMNGSNSAQLAGRVQSVEDKMKSLQDTVASMEASMDLMMTGNSLIGGFSASSSAELSIDTLEVNDANISGNLAVAGRTTVADLGITGKVTAGLLNINGLDENMAGGNAFASINTSVGPLKIQSDAINNVDFMNGKVVFETNGNMRTEGEITVKKINIHTKDVAGASIGNAILPAGDTSIVIDTSSVTENSNIFITPKSKIKLPLSVTEQTAGESFKVEVDTALVEEVKFSWWIIN